MDVSANLCKPLLIFIKLTPWDRCSLQPKKLDIASDVRLVKFLKCRRAFLDGWQARELRVLRRAKARRLAGMQRWALPWVPLGTFQREEK